MASAPRFERAKGAGMGPGDVELRQGSPGEYLAKLWALFGAPDGVADGMAFYGVRDRTSGDEFQVSIDLVGISYRGVTTARVLAAFEKLLAATPVADCRFEMKLGDDTLVLGAQAGVPFEETIRRPPPARTPAIARAKKALARKAAPPTFYSEEMHVLAASAPDAHELLAKLWHRALAVLVTELERELARPKGPSGAIYPLVEAVLPGLEDSAEVAGVDARAAFAPHAKTIKAARAITG